jgi:hypothetical protein
LLEVQVDDLQRELRGLSVYELRITDLEAEVAALKGDQGELKIVGPFNLGNHYDFDQLRSQFKPSAAHNLSTIFKVGHSCMRPVLVASQPTNNLQCNVPCLCAQSTRRARSRSTGIRVSSI